MNVVVRVNMGGRPCVRMKEFQLGEDFRSHIRREDGVVAGRFGKAEFP